MARGIAADSRLANSMAAHDMPAQVRHAAALEAYRTVRASTLALVAQLSAEDCCVQSMVDASPVKWHLAHSTWFFETFILERFEPDFRPHHAAFRRLFNSYYNGVGERHARAQRGNLTRPSHAEVLAYRADVDRRIESLLAGGVAASPAAMPAIDADATPGGVDIAVLVEPGLQHEQQHQELIVTDVLHLLSTNPLQPALRQAPAMTTDAAVGPPPLRWHAASAGVVGIGHDGDGFSFDNETPRHRQFVEAHELASRLVTNGDARWQFSGIRLARSLPSMR